MSKSPIVFPKQIIKCINIARQYPKYYLPLLDQQISSFQNDTEYRINADTICETNQGKEVWIATKKFLENQKPLASLMELQGLNRATESHAIDLEKMDYITHSGSDGSNFVDRILKYCEKSEGALAQIIGNDFGIEDRNHAEMIVLGLIIDDGVTSRGHRTSIFNSEYMYIGCGVGILSGKVVGVINMSQAKLKQKPSYGNVSTSTTNLAQSKMSKVPTCMVDIEEENLSYSRASQNSKKSIASSNSILSGKSHKSQKVWTFTKVEEGQKSFHVQNSPKAQTLQPRDNKDSNISIHNNRKQINQNKYGYETKENISSQMKQSKSKKRPESQINLKQSQSKFSKIDPQSKSFNSQFLGQDITNSHSLNQTKSMCNESTMKSQGSNGFRKIKQKKQTSRVWQEGEFKFEQKTTAIRYIDGTEEEFKEKTSLLLNEDPNL